MSVLVERSMGDLNKEKVVVYPLFQKGATAQPPQPKKQNSQDKLKTTNDPPILGNTAQDLPRRKGKKLKPETTIDATQTPVRDEPLTATPSGTEHGELLEVDPNNGRRKRRKTTLDDEEIVSKRDETLPNDTLEVHGRHPGLTEIASNLSVTTQPGLSSTSISQGVSGANRDEDLEGESSFTSNGPLPDQQTKHQLATGSNDNNGQPPRKVLRLNAKTGTIGSPPAKKPQAIAPSNRKKSTAIRGKPKSKVITFRYGDGQLLPSSIGEKIDQILNGSLSIPAVEDTKPRKVVKRSSPKAAKSTHPFFLGKAAVKESSPEKPAARRSSVIDLTLPERSSPHSRTRPSSCDKPYSPSKSSVPFSGFGASARITKFPGSVEPAWPYKDMVHVRGLSVEPEVLQQQPTTAPSPTSQGKKGKYQAVRIGQEENILGNLAKDLCITNLVDSIRDVKPDEFLPLPDCLRIPDKHLESGFDIQSRVRKELHTRLPAPRAIVQSSSDDDIQQVRSPRSQLHPAILKTYNSISESLSAFDKGFCEPLPWTHKYAPKLACDVLQTGRDVPILKVWLQSLTVKAVEAGLGNENVASSSSKLSGGKAELGGKRKRKAKKLDDFVVSSDEDANEMDEVSEAEDDTLPSASQRQQKRTVFRAGDPTKDSGRAVVISGPHGCGKTAAVYAVAKELGFEVFELNPGSRRNGKDILDRVGDMAHNHQVQRVSGLAPVDGPADEDRRKIDEALANDLKTGRQGTMNSFFKTNATAKPSTKTKPTSMAAIHSTQQTLINKPAAKPRIAAKAQKQSLILIEEADILYKEDTQFWSTIQELIRTSRRPVVITCNDEFPVPLGILPLHAVIRMKAPPLVLAVDYMLLIAACEGHVVRREAVETLYQNRGMDLRAALTDLNFWCQFAIGDQKNGLSWYLPRWPRGSDLDRNGNTLRVVSEGTYRVGMGLLSQDVLESQMHHLDVEEETLHEACDDWNLDMGDWQESLDMESWAQNVQDPSNEKTGGQAALQAYEEFAEAISGADLCSGGLFAADNQITIDASLPELTTKSRDDFTLASRLLEASTTVTYNPLGKDISLWMKSRSRNYLHVEQHVKMDAEVPTELSRPGEADFIRLIQNKATATSPALDRRDFSEAFDPISYPERPSFSNSDKIEISMFDRTTSIIAEDMAPYVRSIVEFDSRLQADREKLSNLISEGGRKGKRMRTTRAAMSALEGGARSTTRREKYFGSLLNPYVVMRTGMQSWTDAARVEMSAGESLRSSSENAGEATTENETDELMDNRWDVS